MVAKSPEELHAELKNEIDRLAHLRQQADSLSDQRANRALAKLDQEQTVDVVKRQVAAAQGDPEAVGEGDRKLFALKAAVDTVESALEWPRLVQETRQCINDTRDVVEAHGTTDEKERYRTLAADAERAIADERVELLRRRVEDLRNLGSRVVWRQPGFWVGYLEYLQERRGRMTDQAAAERLFGQAQRAINSNDIEALKAAVRQLCNLLPAEERGAAEARGEFGGTLI
jgi:hypothetical protein